MTQKHYVERVKDNADEAARSALLQPAQAPLARGEPARQARHARRRQDRQRASSRKGIEKGIDDYMAIGKLLDGGLPRRSSSTSRACRRRSAARFRRGEGRDRRAQLKAYRWTFLSSGMTHPNFDRSLRELSAGATSASGSSRAPSPECEGTWRASHRAAVAAVRYTQGSPGHLTPPRLSLLGAGGGRRSRAPRTPPGRRSLARSFRSGASARRGPAVERSHRAHPPLRHKLLRRKPGQTEAGESPGSISSPGTLTGPSGSRRPFHRKYTAG